MKRYFLYQSSNLRSSLRDFTDIFLQSDPLSSPIIRVAQNIGIENWLERTLTDERGAIMGGRFMLSEKALRFFVEGFPSVRTLLKDSPSRGFLFPDGIKLVLYKVLEEIMEEKDDVFDTLRAYMGESGMRLRQLSDTIADIFSHYGNDIPFVVKNWEKDKPFQVSEEMKNAEMWQRSLWRRVFCRENFPYRHLGSLLADLIDSGEKYEGPTARVVLFGSMFLKEVELKFFQHLSETLEVHHFMLTPSKVFAGNGTVPMAASVPQVPFLQNNGRLMEGFPRLITEEIGVNQKIFWDNPGKEDSMLHRLRASLINDVEFQGTVINDGSLTFHNVNGLQREVEVLKDRILENLRDNPDLKPSQIAVLAPDITVYAPYVESVFSSKDSDGRFLESHLSYNLVNVPSQEEAPYPAILSALLNLPGSRFGRRQINEIFTNPCFIPTQKNQSAVDYWNRVVKDLNVRWGVTPKHREEMGASDLERGSWNQAFERLLSGYYYDEGDVSNQLPAYLSGESDAEAAGILMDFVQELFEDFGALHQKRKTLRGWILFWEKMCGKWITSRLKDEMEHKDEEDELNIQNMIQNLMALDEDVLEFRDFRDSTIPYDMFRPLMEEGISSGRVNRRSSRGVVCASMNVMCAAPFRRIYILGLNEESWPRQDRLMGFDLREEAKGTLHFSREAMDQFLFLEAIFSAEESLSLFYRGRDPQQSEDIEPAAPVRDLLDYLGVEESDLIFHHPLAPYISYPENVLCATFSREAKRMAAFRNKEPVLFDSFEPILEKESGLELIDLHVLHRFLKNPVEYFYKNCIGVAKPTEKFDFDENDVLEIEYLKWWKLRDEVIQNKPKILHNPKQIISDFRERVFQESSVVQSLISDAQMKKYGEELEELSSQFKRIEGEGFNSENSFSFRMEPGASDLPSIFLPEDSAQWFIPSTLDGVVGTINGLRLLNREDSQTWTLLDFISSKKIKASHNLKNWISVLVLGAALGHHAPREIRVFRLSEIDQKARRYFFKKEDFDGSGKSGEKILLENPRKTLVSLVRVFREGHTAPLVLYPELAEKILEDKDFDSFDTKNLAKIAEEKWHEIIKSIYSEYSPLLNCFWRQQYLNQPDFESETFIRAFTDLYRDGGIVHVQ